MAKNDKINIRLEIFKEKNSGKLSIRAHFDSNAPNVAMDSDGYFWIPTYEEKEFINEAFQLIPTDTFAPAKEKIQREDESLGTKPVTHFPKMEKQKDSSIFEQTDNDVIDNHYEKNPFEKKFDIHNKRFEREREEPIQYDKAPRKKEDRVIVEADDAAIDAALKRHWEDDKSFVEVDEQTIIDRVLNQKKKGKWSKK